jgi:histone deacetylase 6
MWEGLQRSMAFTSDTLRLQSKILDTASSLYVNQHSARCARLSCGGVVEMCDAVASGRIRNGFAIVRPPGHHAEPDGAMGFCFYNNVAVAARWLQQKYGSVNDQTRCKKIMILDWDVHHGNGTQSAFWNDPDILYVSIHRFEPGFYPPGQAGNANQVGSGPGVGRNVNIPWPCAMMGDADYVAAFRQIVMPIATEFDPDLVIISAGFDAARGDHLGECDVTPNGYGQMTYDLARLANGRLVVALEGGYNLDSIANSAVEVTEVLLGEAPKALEEPTRVCSTTASETLRMVEHIQSEHWACMRREPRAPIDDGIQEEVDGVSDAIVSLSSLHSAYRMQRVATKYDLTEFPLGSEVLGAHCLSSSTILDSDTRNVILFVHDMGNLRLELPWLHRWDVKQELGYIVDASAQVRSWASEKNVKLIDINLDTESELQSGNANDWHGQRLAGTGGAESRRLARLALLHVWDDTINILHLTSNAEGWPLKVVLIGLGAGCDAITNLIEKRRVKECVKAVIQVPYHASVPELPKDSMKRKWYFSHSQVYLPLNHRIYHSEDDILATAKRFGKVIRSSEARAARVLRHEFEPIAAFIEESFSK